MSKKYFAAIAAILAITVVFTACEEETITDREGNSHAYMTDENSEILQDENGDIVVPKTDANGKKVKDKDGNLVTESITYPEVLEMDGYVQNKYFKSKIQEGWEQIGKLTIMVEHTETGAQYTLDVREGETPDNIEAEYMKLFDQQKKSDLVDEFNVKKKEVELGGKKMLKLTRDYTLKEKNTNGSSGQIYDVYILGDEGRTFVYTGIINHEHKGKVDFDKIISEIIYK